MTDPRQHVRMRDNVILRVIGKAMIPFFFLFALYVQFHGDFGPGGGFQAGVIFAAGIVLYGLIYGVESAMQVFPKKAAEIGVSLGVLIWGAVGITTMVKGGRYLEYGRIDPSNFTHGQHLGIISIELGVLFTVTCGMTLIFYLFAGRGRR